MSKAVIGIYIMFFLMLGYMTYNFYLENLDGTVFNKPIVFYNDITHLETDKPVYQRGEMIRVKLSFCKYRQYNATNEWHLINNINYSFGQKQSSVNLIGCKGVGEDYWSEVGRVPSQAINGTHHVEAVNHIFINAKRTLNLEFKSVDFEVAGGGSDKNF